MTLRVGEIVIDGADHEAVVPFWLAAMGDYARVDVNDQYVGISPNERAVGRPAILFQRVPEPKSVKNRATSTCAARRWRARSSGCWPLARR